MSLQNKRAADAAMAARMKSEGVKRTSCRCPACHKVVPVDNVANHVAFQCAVQR